MSIFPVRESVTSTDFGSDVTTHAASMPATVNAGDLLLAFAAYDGTCTITTPAGWTLLAENPRTNLSMSAYGRVADGTEGGTTVDFATNNAQQGTVQCYRFSSWAGSLEPIAVAFAGGTDTSFTQFVLRVGAPAQDYHWVAAQGKSGATGFGSTPPTGYSNNSGSGADSASSAAIVSATRTNNGNLESVTGWWLIGANASCAVIVAVPPRGSIKRVRPAAQMGV